MGEIADYLASLPDDRRAVLQPYYDRARELVPDVEEGLSYAMPAWKTRGKALVSLAATKAGYSVYPFSGKALDRVVTEADGVERTAGSVHFTAADPLPLELFDRIVLARLAEIESGRRRGR